MPTKAPAKDPFAQAPGAEDNGQPAKDPFGQPATGGNFPKLADLWGCLLMITPKGIKEVPDNFNKGKTKMQLTATVLVVDGPPAEELAEHGMEMPDVSKWLGKRYVDMWINNSPIVKAADAAMDDGIPSILGRLWRFPTSDDKDTYADRWELENALAEAAAKWRPGQPPINIRSAWSLERFTDEDAAKARALLASKNGGNS